MRPLRLGRTDARAGTAHNKESPNVPILHSERQARPPRAHRPAVGGRRRDRLRLRRRARRDLRALERVDGVCRRRHRDRGRQDLQGQLVDAGQRPGDQQRRHRHRPALDDHHQLRRHAAAHAARAAAARAHAAAAHPGPARPRRRRPAPTGCAPWNAATAYSGGATVTEAGKTYKANWWTQGDDPATHNGATGTGQPWTIVSSCSATPAPPAPTPPAPTPPAPRRPHPRPRRRRRPRRRPRRLPTAPCVRTS